MAAPRRIFISYRRGVTTDLAGRMYDRLESHFGAGSVFRDFDDIPAGQDFAQRIHEEIDASDVVVVVIGTDWISRGNLSSPQDWVRTEIESALVSDKPIIPVRAHGCDLPSAEDLPKGLRPLLFRNAIKVTSDEDFPLHMARLISAIEASIGAVAPPTPSRSSWAPRAALGAMGAAAIVGVASALTVSGKGAVSVQLLSTPPGADIVLDGRPLQTLQGEAMRTPATTRPLRSGTHHRLELSLAGYAPHASTFVVEEGASSRVSVTLEPLPGIVEVLVQGPLADRVRILAGDEEWGRGARVQRQLPGLSQVRVRGALPGARCRTEPEEVTVAPGETTNLEVRCSFGQRVRQAMPPPAPQRGRARTSEGPVLEAPPLVKSIDPTPRLRLSELEVSVKYIPRLKESKARHAQLVATLQRLGVRYEAKSVHSMPGPISNKIHHSEDFAETCRWLLKELAGVGNLECKQFAAPSGSRVARQLRITVGG